MADVPTRTASALYPVRLRQDLTRDEASEYWAGTHADIVRKLPLVAEYNQHRFSTTDHGFWPGDHAETTVAESERIDGIAELRFGIRGALWRFPARLRAVLVDEQNIFRHDVARLAVPRGGTCWSTGHDDELGQRAAVLIRRRYDASGKDFRRFVHQVIGPALVQAGARDVRAYSFIPGPAHPTPGVRHDDPESERHHGVLLFGASDRAALESVIHSSSVVGVVAEQNRVCSAVHAYAVDRTIPVIRTDQSHRRSNP